MEIFEEKWYKAIQNRHSRRKYIEKEIDNNILNSLNRFIENWNNKIQGTRAVLVENGNDDVFKGIIGSYGKITGAPSYIIFIGNKSDEHYLEKTGYLGEGIILEATAQKLNTCWVGGFFNSKTIKENIQIKDQEKIVAVSPLGYSKDHYSFMEKVMSKLVSSHKRENLEELCEEGFNENWPEWIKTALKCARLAPSAVNRQPWKFKVNDESITVKYKNAKFSSKISEYLDCGIAMLHLEIGAHYKDVKGYWEYCEDPEVAKFIIR